MSVVKIEFQIKGGEKVTTTNEKIIKQLVEQGAKYKVLEGAIEDIIETQNDQVESVEEVSKSYKEVLSEYKENEKQLKALAIAGDTTSEEYRKLSQSVGAARAQLEEANRAANNQKGIFDATLGTLGGVTAGFAAVQGAIGLLGVESEETQKALLKVQSALALTQGIKQFQEAIPAFKNLSTIVKGPVVGAFNGLKAAIGATGIGLIVIAVGLLVTNWEKLVDALRTTFPAFRVIDKFFKNFKNNALGAVSAVLEAFKVVGDVLKNLFRGNIRQAVADAKSFGSRVGEAYQEGFNEAVEKEQAKARVKQLQDDLAFAQARGEQTLELERRLLEERLKLVKKNSDEEKDIKLELERVNTQIRKKAEDDIKASEERITAAKKVDAERRVFLMREGLQRELAQLKLNYEQQRQEAIKNGQDLRLVDELYFKQRAELITQSGQQVVNILNKYDQDIINNSRVRYRNEILLLKNRLDEEIKLINNSADEEINKEEEITKVIEKNAILRAQIDQKYLVEATQSYINFKNDVIGNIEELYFRQNDIVNTSLNEQIEITEKLYGQLRGAILFQQRDIINDEFLYRKRLFEIAFDADDENLRLGIDLFKKKKDLSDQEFDFINGRTRELLQKNKDASDEQLDILLQETKKKSSIRKQADLDELERVRQRLLKNAELEAEFRVQSLILDKDVNQESLKNQLDYYNELNDISAKNTRDRKKQELAITQRFERDEVKIRIDFLRQKLDAAKKAFGEESEEFKKLQLEKAKLEKKFTESSVQQIKLTRDQYEQLFQQFLSTLAEVGAAIDSFYELEAARTNRFYDEEVQKNEDARNAEVNNYALSREEQQNINQRYALQEAEIEEKRAEEIKKIEKKRSDTAFAFKIAEIIGNGALAFTRALAELGPIAGPIAASLVATTVAAQLLQARNQRKITQQLEDGGLLVGASHSQGGIPVGNTGIEVEGGEAVINKKSTSRFLPMLDAINRAEGGAPLMPRTTTFMQRGGMMQTSATSQGGNVVKTYVVTEEVSSKQAMTARIKRQSQF